MNPLNTNHDHNPNSTGRGDAEGKNMRKLKLTKGRYAIVDDDRFETLSKYKWHCNDHGYVRRNSVIGKGVRMPWYLHWDVLGKPKRGLLTDHINRNILGNRVSNLRHVTQSQNQINTGKRVDNVSGYKGVSFHKASGKWMSQIRNNGIKIYLGLFSSKKLAYEAYRLASIKRKE